MRKSIITIDDFSGGLNLFDEKHQIKMNQSPFCKNAIFYKKGAIRKRFGYDRISKISSDEENGGMRGMIKFIKMPTAGNEEIERKIIVAFGKKIYSWKESTNNFLEIGEIEDDKEIVRGIVYDNEVILGDGVSTTKKWNGDENISSLESFNAPKSNCFLVFNEIFLARDSESKGVVKYADPADITVWNPATANNAGFLAPENNNGEIVKGIAKFQNKLFIFKETGKYSAPLQFDEENALIGFSSVEFDDGNDGCIAPHSILNGENTLFFLGEEGFSSYGMQENFPDRRASKHLSFAIEPLLEQIEYENREKISATKFENRYFVACPIGQINTNNTVIFYDTFYSSWGVWDIPMQDMDSFIFKNKRELFFTSSISPTINKLNNEFIDDKNDEGIDGNLPIEFFYETPEMFLGNANRIDIVRISGKITEEGETKVFLISGKNSMEFSIDKNDILNEDIDESGIGSFGIGNETIGTKDNIFMKKFVKIIQFPALINENKYFSLQIQNNEINSGIELNKIEFLGEKKRNSLKRTI